MTDRDSSQYALQPDSPLISKPFDTEQLNRFRDQWLSHAIPQISLDINDNTTRIGVFPVSEVLDCLFGHSPYLSRSVIRHPQCVESLAHLDPDTVWSELLKDLRSGAEAAASDRSKLMKCLRFYKERASLYIAVYDIVGLWALEDVTGHLSSFADFCIEAALNAVLRSEADAGNIDSQSPDRLSHECGIFILALGKLGAEELNYSSDIDLMVLFDSEAIPYTGSKSPQEFAIKVAKALVKILEERTADGYVFRTDLRLRPGPSSTALAVSTASAELYYESWGQNWERSALIKARYVAGDSDVARKFLSELIPFVWRKSLDFYAIQDIHSIKRQIYAAKGGRHINILGHDIKTGRGGIREIEFFVQIQQLIWGGRNPILRDPQTLTALNQLFEDELVSETAKKELETSYQFLRRLEHRIQMINDEQTQVIPADTDRASLVASFCGFASLNLFCETVEHHLAMVERHYADLFEDAPDLTVDGNLVFTGADHDPDTLKTLERMGYSNPEAVSQIIRTWHHGRYRATRSTRSRQILTELVPTLLKSFGKTAQPDRAFLKFDQSLQKLPAGIQLFSVFYSNPEILDLVAEIMGDAPSLADYLTASTHRIDYVLDPVFFDSVPDQANLEKELISRLGHHANYEEKLVACVGWTNDLRFRIGVQVLRGIISPLEGSGMLTHVAEAVLRSLVPTVREEFSEQFGHVEQSSLAVLAYGKLGACEMMPTSDLDLVIIYDSDESAASQGGSRSLPASAYFIRLSQRIVSALSMMTSEGRLFEVDLRLRPSGDQGPFACSLKSFEKYHESDAWVWEHLALTRARVVFATADLGQKVGAVISKTLTQERVKSDIQTAVLDMQEKLQKEFGGSHQNDLKRMPGGLMDSDFVLQYHALMRSGLDQGRFPTRSIDILDRLVASNRISQDDYRTLRDAFVLRFNLLWILRLTLGENLLPSAMPMGLEARLLKLTGAATLEEINRQLVDTSNEVLRVFNRDIGIKAVNSNDSR